MRYFLVIDLSAPTTPTVNVCVFTAIHYFQIRGLRIGGLVGGVYPTLFSKSLVHSPSLDVLILDSIFRSLIGSD